MGTNDRQKAVRFEHLLYWVQAKFIAAFSFLIFDPLGVFGFLV